MESRNCLCQTISVFAVLVVFVLATPPYDGVAGTLQLPTAKMYWTDIGTDKIQRANLDGSSVEDLVTVGLSNPWGIAVDISGGKMYWTDSDTDKIQRADLDGSNVEGLVTTGLGKTWEIALDLSGGKIYWADMDTNKIQRANLDGSNIEDLVTTGLDDPSGIALDLSAGKMYWTDIGTDKIQRANLDGSNSEDLVMGLDSPYYIALDVSGGKMYWTDYGNKKIQRAGLDGNNVEDLVTGLSDPAGIAIVQAVCPYFKVDPRQDFDSSGGEGGPFDPCYMEYTLTNDGDSLLDWTVEPNVIWIGADSNSGTLLPDAHTTVMISINVHANDLEPNIYTGTIVFQDLTNDCNEIRQARLTVTKIPGEIEVTDSIPPPNDLKMPFGDVVVDSSRTEQITITNTDPNHELYVTDISLIKPFEDFYDDFESGNLNNWRLNVGGSGDTPLVQIDSTLEGGLSPHSGQYVAYLGDSTNDWYAHSTMDLVIDLSGLSEAELNFWWVTKNLESGHYIRLDIWDGSWHENVNNWAYTGESWQQRTLDLSSYNLIEGFTVRFHSYMDYKEDGDAAYVDDVSITAGSNGGAFTSQGFRLENIPDLNEPIPPLSSIMFDVNFTPTDYTDYESTLVITSDDKDEPNIVLQLSGSAIEDYIKIIPDVNIVTEFYGHPGGPFLPSSTSYRLTNVGPNDIDWVVEPNVPWLNIDPNSGTLQPGDSNSIKVTVRPNAEAGTLLKGKHCGDLVFTDLTTTIEQARKVCLDVYTMSKVWISPYSFDVTISRGDCLTEILTIGNKGDSPLNFEVSAYSGGGGGPPPPPPPRRRSTIYAAAHEAKDRALLSRREVDFTSLDENSYVEGELLVRFAPKTNGTMLSFAEKSMILRNLDGATIEKEYGIVPGLCLVKLPVGITVEQALASLDIDAGILYAEPDYELRFYAKPNDGRFWKLWGMHNTEQTGGKLDADIDAPEAWDICTGSSDTIVAVIDTGIDYRHDDLKGNLWVNTIELSGRPDTDDGNGYKDDIYGYDFGGSRDSDPNDEHYHGTHVAGTIGAAGNNSEGVAGVCWNIRIMSLKAMPPYKISEWKAFVSNAVGAINYAIENGANVINASWGIAGNDSNSLKDAVEATAEAGILFVVAAGNDEDDNDKDPNYPSSYTFENIIAVLSTNKYDGLSSFSNYGLNSVDIGAPGSDILSTFPTEITPGMTEVDYSTTDYFTISGTSMAAPHVAGACALVWSVCPSLSHLEVKDIIMRTVDPVDDLQGKCVSGGRLNLHKALLAALEQAESTTGWLEVEPSTGYIPPGGVVDVNVTFCADPPPGTYSDQITIDSNDPYRPTIKIPVTMTVVPVDYFTELFDLGNPFHPYSLSSPNSFSDPNRNDMAYRTLTFVPDNGSASYYKAGCSEAASFPVDPNGGTEISLRDDDYIEVNLLGGEDVNFYGIEYETCYIGSNGYITFEAPDIRHHESLTDHFELPRISALFDDLDPSAGGIISWKQLSDRVVLTFENVPELGISNSNSFQIEIFFNGTIRITWLDVAAPDGLVGLSEGIGLTPYFVESDLSEYNLQGVLDGDYHIGFADYARLAAYWLAADCKADNNWCFGTDIDKDGSVAFNDLTELAGRWLECIGAECN